MFHYHSNRMYSAQSSCKYDRLSILFYDSSYHIMHVVCDIQEVEFVRGESPSARDWAYDGANDRANDWAIERSSDRASDRAIARAIERSSDRAIEWSSDRASERSCDRASNRAIERSSDKCNDRRELIMSPAPDVLITYWLVCCAAFFKTKSSKTLPMLKHNEKDHL